MRVERLFHSFRLLLCKNSYERANYLKKKNVLGHIGENCKWGPILLPLYPKLIRLHNNVVVHKTARIVTHDMINSFLMMCYPDEDFGWRERLGCVEIMDNVYIGMNAVIMPGVRINKNVIVAAGSVVTSDIPSNTIVQGIPAKPVGRFDMFVALRKMEKGLRFKFPNQELPDKIAVKEWERFYKKRDKDMYDGKM